MAKLIGASINLAKIPKDAIIKGEKGQYVNVTIAVNDEENEYGQNTSITLGQSKEQREAKEPKVYLGNGKTFWSNDGDTPAATQSAAGADFHEDDDDLPF